jgi:hypothetical protein
MPRPYANDPIRQDKAPSSDVVRLVLIACGITVLLGLVTGVLWIGFNLVRYRVWP